MADYEDITYEIDDAVTIGLSNARAFAEKRPADFGQFVTA
jgi:hypothetical protein